MIFVIIVIKNLNKISKSVKMSVKQKNIDVLIVEDETILALQLKSTLMQFGYGISGIEAEGERAIRHIDSHLPDMVLLDIRLKGSEDGTVVGKTIWNRHHIPIIYLTSHSDEKSMSRAMLSEPYGYLTKPFRDEDLKTTLQSAWHKHMYFYPTFKCTSPHKHGHVALAGGYCCDPSSGELSYQGQAIKLTGNELKLLQILGERPGKIVNFEQLFNYIWRDGVYDLAKLRNVIYRFRQKTDTDILENVFETGYRLKVL